MIMIWPRRFSAMKCEGLACESPLCPTTASIWDVLRVPIGCVILMVLPPGSQRSESHVSQDCHHKRYSHEKEPVKPPARSLYNWLLNKWLLICITLLGRPGSGACPRRNGRGSVVRVVLGIAFSIHVHDAIVHLPGISPFIYSSSASIGLYLYADLGMSA